MKYTVKRRISWESHCKLEHISSSPPFFQITRAHEHIFYLDLLSAVVLASLLALALMNVGGTQRITANVL